ncbi:MAG: hypothetical protein IKN38_01920 [Clostridia bacterium]|nr:hypothetical protein [Clostridia bacterium]
MNYLFDGYEYNTVFNIKERIYNFRFPDFRKEAYDTVFSSVAVPITEDELETIKSAKLNGCAMQSIVKLHDLVEAVERAAYYQENEQFRKDHPESVRVDADFVIIDEINW